MRHVQWPFAGSALLSCMAYVDLNSIRAGMEDTPETSDYTSIQERIKPVFDLQKAIQQQIENGDMQEFKAELKPLLHFEPGVTNLKQTGILYKFTDYLELLDWTGRFIRDDKRGSINAGLPPILTRLGISAKQWHINTTQFEVIHNRRFNRSPNIDTG